MKIEKKTLRRMRTKRTTTTTLKLLENICEKIRNDEFKPCFITRKNFCMSFTCEASSEIVPVTCLYESYKMKIILLTGKIFKKKK